MAKLVSDLFSAVGQSTPGVVSSFATTPALIPDDFEITSVAGLVEVGSGPYEPGEEFRVEMTFNGAGSQHSALASHSGNYTQQGSSGGEVTPLATQGVYPEIRFEVDSAAADGDYEIYATYDEDFNAAESGVGVQQIITVTVEGFSVSVSASPQSDTEIDVSYDITNGTADYDVVIERKLDGEADSAYSTIHTDTHTSEGTYSHLDTGLDDTETYWYRVTVTDESGAGESVQDEDSASPIGTG